MLNALAPRAGVAYAAGSRHAFDGHARADGNGGAPVRPIAFLARHDALRFIAAMPSRTA